MPSSALWRWQSGALTSLDELEAAHALMGGGTGPGRRYATRQLNHAYVVALAAHFQGFCRDLHSEAAAALASATSLTLQVVVGRNLTHGRGLDIGNAHSGTINGDFLRLGVDLWAQAKARDARNAARLAKVDQLNLWRNAIAHQDFTTAAGKPLAAGSTPDLLLWVRRWRCACEQLAPHFDAIVAVGLVTPLGTAPW